MDFKVYKNYKQGFSLVRQNLGFYFRFLLLSILLLLGHTLLELINPFLSVAYLLFVFTPLFVVVWFINSIRIVSGKKTSIISALKKLNVKIYTNLILVQLLFIGTFIIYMIIPILLLWISFMITMSSTSFGVVSVAASILTSLAFAIYLFNNYILVPARICFMPYFIIFKKQSALRALNSSIKLSVANKYNTQKIFMAATLYLLVILLLVIAVNVAFMQLGLTIITGTLLALAVLASIIFITAIYASCFLVTAKLFLISHKSLEEKPKVGIIPILSMLTVIIVGLIFAVVSVLGITKPQLIQSDSNIYYNQSIN